MIRVRHDVDVTMLAGWLHIEGCEQSRWDNSNRFHQLVPPVHVVSRKLALVNDVDPRVGIVRREDIRHLELLKLPEPVLGHTDPDVEMPGNGNQQIFFAQLAEAVQYPMVGVGSDDVKYFYQGVLARWKGTPWAAESVVQVYHVDVVGAFRVKHFVEQHRAGISKVASVEHTAEVALEEEHAGAWTVVGVDQRHRHCSIVSESDNVAFTNF